MYKWGIDGFGENPIKRIEETKANWNKTKKDLDYAKYLEELIHKDFICSIKQYQTAWDYRIPTIKSAVDELSITDKRRKRPNLNCLNRWIKDEFFPKVDIEINVNNIISYGYEGYHWQMSFDIDGEEYAISVPNKSQITMENADHAYEGKYAFLHRTSESSISVEYTAYTEENMAEFIEDYVDDLRSID